MSDWLRLTTLAPHEQLLALLAAGVILLTTMVIGFAVIALVLRLRNERRARKFGRLEAAWEDDVLDALGGAPPSERLRTIAPTDSVFFVELLARFARRLSGAERRLLSELAAPYLARTASRAGARNAATRAHAVQSLCLLGMPEHASIVVRALDDRSDLVAMTAARALARPEHAWFADDVIARVRRFQGWDRGYLTAMLVAMGRTAIPSLLQLLTNSRQPAGARAVAAALQELNDLVSAEVASSLLRRETDAELLAACLRLVQHVGTPAHLDDVRPHLSSRHDPVRGAAVGALAALEDPDKLGAVEAALEDPSFWVALQAARGLRQARDLAPLEAVAAAGGHRATLAMQVLNEPDL